MIDRLWATLLPALLGAFWALTAMASEVGLVTALGGTAGLRAEGQPERPLQAFVKVREGDRLNLAEGARLQLVFFKSGREETWQGAGILQVDAEAGRALTDGWQAGVRQLPKVLVKQLARTPAPDGNLRAGMVRLRSMPSGGTLESVEKNYAELRRQSAADDRNPELYLLAGYFELREFAKLENLLRRMDSETPGSPEIALLRSLYSRAVQDAKSAEQR